jgi:hypothetical protein
LGPTPSSPLSRGGKTKTKNKNMLGISNFLQKFLKLDHDNILKVSVILETIKKVINIELTKEDLEIKGDNLRLKCNPVFRNEIFMHKSQIEESLKSQKIFLSIV